MNIQCLITGGSGFIGSHLCHRILAKGYDVYCLDNLSTGDKKNISHLLSNSRFHFYKMDIVNPWNTDLLDKLKNLRYIYHLASPASPPQYQKLSIETLLVNSIGTYNVLEIAKKTNSKFLLASTSEVYGDPLKHPQQESYFGNVNPVGVRACYDEGKRFAEAITMEYKRKHQIQVRIVRIFNTFGPRMQVSDGRVISNFVNQAISGQPITIYGDGLQTRSFCYIKDMVDGLILALESNDLDGEVINLGYPEEHTILEIANIILQLTCSTSKIIFLDKKVDDPIKRKPDITKAKKILGWRPKISFLEGLKETIAFFSKT